MGVKASENELSDTLKNSGYNVELALERILTGNFGGDGGASLSSTRMSSTSTPSASSSSSKRQKYSGGNSNTPSSSGGRSSSSGSRKSQGGIQYGIGSATKSTQQQQQHPTNRLLLCKRWTVACSKSTRGRVNYGEVLDFSENYRKNNNNEKSSPTMPNKKKAKISGIKKLIIDPLVRFRSYPSGEAEGTLNRYLCSILSPLLRLPATNNARSNQILPLISIEGEALMEDRHLVIGSDVPISIKIYVNDPVAFFDLFQQNNGGGTDDTSSKLFFRKNNAKGSKNGQLPSYQGKKVKSSFSEEELAEAAFHLLQWAERGEEMPLFGNDDSGNGKEGKKKKSNDDYEDTRKVNKDDDDDGSNSSSKEVVGSTINDEDNDADGDYEDNSMESEQVDELNQLVVTGEEAGKTKKTLLPPELSDPTGFKSGVVLRPYQRQALHWMCRREGCHIQGETGNKDGDGMKGLDNNDGGVDGELDLLAELASTTYSSKKSDASIQVWGGGDKAVVACDCGPVVVNDESVASRAIPVIEYGKKSSSSNEGKRKYVHHPLWRRRFLATEDLGSVVAFYVNELLGIASATPPNPPSQCVGGILADAMGLGKTVMLLSLILKTKEEDEVRGLSGREKTVDTSALKSDCTIIKRKRGSAPKDDVVDLLSDVESASECQVDDDDSWTEGEQDATTAMEKPSLAAGNSKGTTLVIAPLSLISQWEEELASKTDLSHLVYYDSTKKTTGGDAFSCVDVVVTTYGTVQSEFVSLSRSSKSIGVSMEPGHSHSLLKFGWKRIILDEAHGIKNPSTVVSKACCMLKAQTRWCVTGTPIQNSLQDVYGLLKFLRHEPWCESTFWKNAITDSLSGVSTGAGNASAMVTENDAATKESSSQELRASAAFGRVRRVLAPIILRRTKDTLTEDGTPILSLPPIDFSDVHVTLSPPEREFYNALLQRSQSVFEGFLNAGTASKSWFAIFSLLQRLRQACDHVSLTVNKKLEMSELPRLKDSHEVVRESSNDSGVGTVVDDSFLSDLLNKFKKNANMQDESTSFVQSTSNFAQQVAESLSQCVQSNDDHLNSECPICLEEPRLEDAVHTPCAHMFCRECILSEFQEQIVRTNKKTVNLDMFKKAGASNEPKAEGGSCPVCHDWVKVSSIIQIEKSETGEVISKYLKSAESEKENSPKSTESEKENAPLQRDVVAREALESALNGASSAKLEAILAELEKVWKLDGCSKVLIFSQYLGFLDIIGEALNNLGVECFRIDGKMTLKERVAMIGKFNKNKPTKSNGPPEEGASKRGSVFLVSMKAGGVGLNLVAASSVFIIDPWWNQALEDQCISRIHRIGQQAKVVRVRKFVVTDSVEEKIVNLQGKKKGMANEILSDADSGGQLDSTKPTLEDFKLLFGR